MNEEKALPYFEEWFDYTETNLKHYYAQLKFKEYQKFIYDLYQIERGDFIFDEFVNALKDKLHLKYEGIIHKFNHFVHDYLNLDYIDYIDYDKQNQLIMQHLNAMHEEGLLDSKLIPTIAFYEHYKTFADQHLMKQLSFEEYGLIAHDLISQKNFKSLDTDFIIGQISSKDFNIGLFYNYNIKLKLDAQCKCYINMN